MIVIITCTVVIAVFAVVKRRCFKQPVAGKVKACLLNVCFCMVMGTGIHIPMLASVPTNCKSICQGDMI